MEEGRVWSKDFTKQGPGGMTRVWRARKWACSVEGPHMPSGGHWAAGPNHPLHEPQLYSWLLWPIPVLPSSSPFILYFQSVPDSSGHKGATGKQILFVRGFRCCRRALKAKVGAYSRKNRREPKPLPV